MTLGKKLRELRMLNNFSQPELSEKVGIEQSYLSKLENDKSIPSSEVFMALLTVFRLSVEEFLRGFGANDDKSRLHQVAEIERYLNGRQQSNLSYQRGYLYFCSFLIISAITLFYIGYGKQMFSETVYQYESDGVVMMDEPKDIFRRWQLLMSVGDRSTKDAVFAKRLEMQKRKDLKEIISPVHSGQQFEVDVEGGYRHYYLGREMQVARPINAWLKVFGVMLFVTGLMGFILERKFFKELSP